MKDVSGIVAMMESVTVQPTEKESAIAQDCGAALSSFLRAKRAKTVRVLLDGSNGLALTVPVSAVRILLEVLTQMAQGNAVTLTPIHAELTTQEAADILNVSRPYFISLLDAGKIPYRKVGTRRRVRYEDVMQFKEALEVARLQTLEELAAYEQGLGMR